MMLSDVPESSSCRPFCLCSLRGPLILLSLVLHMWWSSLSMGSHFSVSTRSSSLFLLVDCLGLYPLGAPLDYSSPLELSSWWSHRAGSFNALSRALCSPIYGDFLHCYISDKLCHLVNLHANSDLLHWLDCCSRSWTTIASCCWFPIALCTLKISDLWSLGYSHGVWKDLAWFVVFLPNPNVLVTPRLPNTIRNKSPITASLLLRPRILLRCFLFTNLFAFVLFAF